MTAKKLPDTKLRKIIFDIIFVGGNSIAKVAEFFKTDEDRIKTAMREPVLHMRNQNI